MRGIRYFFPVMSTDFRRKVDLARIRSPVPFRASPELRNGPGANQVCAESSSNFVWRVGQWPERGKEKTVCWPKVLQRKPLPGLLPVRPDSQEVTEYRPIDFRHGFSVKADRPVDPVEPPAQFIFWTDHGGATALGICDLRAGAPAAVLVHVIEGFAFAVGLFQLCHRRVVLPEPSQSNGQAQVCDMTGCRWATRVQKKAGRLLTRWSRRSGLNR